MAEWSWKETSVLGKILITFSCIILAITIVGLPVTMMTIFDIISEAKNKVASDFKRIG